MKDKELLKYVKEFTKGITESNSVGKCYMVVAPLSTLLDMSGVENEIEKGIVIYKGEEYEHFWIKLKDGRILDPTSDQFKKLNLKCPYLGKMPTRYCYEVKSL